MESERNQLIMSKENLYNELKKLHEANEKLREQVNIYCIPESFNTNIAHQLFDYTITFVYQKAFLRILNTSFWITQ